MLLRPYMQVLNRTLLILNIILALKVEFQEEG
jgi:hypothetical protein